MTDAHTEKLFAQFLADILMIAHVEYQDETGLGVVSMTRDAGFTQYTRTRNPREFPGRNITGLCSFVSMASIDSFRAGQIDPLGRRDVGKILAHAFEEMYGRMTDPFSYFPGGSYEEARLDYKIRSREAKRIAEHLAAKYGF